MYTFIRTVMYRITNVYAARMSGVFMISLGKGSTEALPNAISYQAEADYH